SHPLKKPVMTLLAPSHQGGTDCVASLVESSSVARLEGFGAYPHTSMGSPTCKLLSSNPRCLVIARVPEFSTAQRSFWPFESTTSIKIDEWGFANFTSAIWPSTTIGVDVSNTRTE